jgi:hypothetical protein
VTDTTPLEQTILDDIRRRTGFSFRKLGGIDTRVKEVAHAVFPVLKDWLAVVKEDNYRRALFACFHTPEAYGYLDNLLCWWENESDKQSLSLLTQAIALLVKSQDADRVWNLCQRLPKRPHYHLLLSKLAAFPTVESELKDALVLDLNNEDLSAADLSYIARVNDPRINRWFAGQVDSPDSYIRKIAKSVVAKGRKWPKGVEYAAQAPDRTEDVFSTEVDLENLGQLLARLAKDFGLKIPTTIKRGMFLSSAELNRWIVVHASSAAGPSVDFWFRLEDVDTVEVVLSKQAMERATIH